jgi:hypothetical protein
MLRFVKGLRNHSCGCAHVFLVFDLPSLPVVVGCPPVLSSDVCLSRETAIVGAGMV